MPPLRFGTLGAARITPLALIAPARDIDGVQVDAVAARSVESARDFAKAHDIPDVFDDYDALIAAPDLDCIYNPLPNGLHGAYTIAALRAGKHVLCEKPLAANEAEAEAMFRVAEENDRVLVEAVHYIFHPLAAEVRRVIADGEIGELERVTSSFHAPIHDLGDIRFDLGLAGGALMDLGSYCMSIVRMAAGEEPEITSAEAVVGPPGIDLALEATLAFSSGVTGHIACETRKGFEANFEAHGSGGRLHVSHPFHPQMRHAIELETESGTRSYEVDRTPTFQYQLEAFRDQVVDGAALPIDAANSIGNLRAIDAVYEAAGLGRRQPTPI